MPAAKNCSYSQIFKILFRSSPTKNAADSLQYIWSPTIPYWPTDHICTQSAFHMIRRPIYSSLSCRKINPVISSCYQRLNDVKNSSNICVFFFAEMVFCYQNCSDLLREKIVLVIEKNFWNWRLKAKNFQNFWYHLNNLFKQSKVRTIFGNRMLF